MFPVPFELFEDDLVHAGSGLDESGYENGKAAPSSMLLAAPKNRFGGYSAVESTPPDRIRLNVGVARCCGRQCQPGDRVGRW